jgi:phosphate/phosphite/phosphonate ABC transporter binding protein
MPEDPHDREKDLNPEDEASLAEEAALDQTDVLPPTPMVGGKYKLGRLIGEGGMGAVYEAEHTGLGVRVAVKLLNEVFVSDPAAMQRFRREARAAAAIRHPNIVEVTDTGTDEEGVPFIVMELLEGESLSALLRREKVMPPLLAATIASQILAGLAAAHDKNVIHRDLKPGNIILARQHDGSCQVKVLDFGISKFFTEGTIQDVTAIGAVIGTPRFMAPEQARGQSDLDGRVDIYAVGVLLYRMLTGKLPFAAKSHEEIIHHILHGKLRPPRAIKPEVSEELERIILRAMAADRAERYQTAREFLLDLQQTLPEVANTTVQITAHSGVTNTPTPLSLSTGSVLSLGITPVTREASPHALRGRRSRGRLRLALPLLALLALGAGLGWYFGWGGGKRTTITPKADAGVALGGPPLRLGITEYLPRRQLVREHAALVSYLSKRLRRPVVLRVNEDYIDLSGQLAAGKLDMAALSSYAYVRAKRRWPGLKLLATHVTTSGTSYEGYIVTKADTGVRTLQDLAGKVFCYVGPSSTSGYLYPRAIFRQQGLDPDKAFKATRFTGDHLSALKALESRACHGAAVFAGIFFEARKHGMQPERFRILASTARIPYDAYCVPPSLPADLVHSLREALLALKPGSETAIAVLGKNSRVTGFAAAKDSDWDPVRRIEKYIDEPESPKKKKGTQPGR